MHLEPIEDGEIRRKSLDLFDCGHGIVINPAHKGKFEERFKQSEEDLYKCGIFLTKAIRVTYDAKVPEKTEGKGWIRSKLLDSPFVTWVDDEELEKPKSWQKFFGFVEKEMVDCVWIIRDYDYLVNPRYAPYDNYIMNQQRRSGFLGNL